MKLYSQRDPAWKSIPLGTSRTTTIGSHGCTITSLAMAADLTPKEVNEKLNKVGGYANTNLIIWSKIKEAIPWMEFEFRGYSYDNQRVSSAISKNGFCLVEVDATRIGAPTHWVLYIGNQRMYDPWTGVEKATNYYPAKGYAVINRVGNPPSMPKTYKGLDLTNEDSMKVAVDVWADVRDGKYISKDEHSRIVSELKSDIDKEKSIVSETKKTLESFKETLASKLTTIVDTAEIIGAVERLLSRETELQREVTKVEKAYALLEAEKAEEIKSLKAELENLAIELIDSREKYEKQIGNLKQRVEQLGGSSETGKSQKAVFEALEGLITTITNLLRRDK